MSVIVGDPFLTKRHDTGPFSDQLLIQQSPGSATYVPLSLVGCAVRFLVGQNDKTHTPVFGGAAHVDDAPTGLVSYFPTPEDMALASFAAADFPLRLLAEWEITFADGTIRTVPGGDQYRPVIIGAHLEAE